MLKHWDVRHANDFAVFWAHSFSDAVTCVISFKLRVLFSAMSTPQDASAAAQRIFPPNVLYNSSLTTVKFLTTCFSGAVAGILGLTNWHGFALFFVATLFTSACIYFINCKRKPSKYIPGGIGELVNPGQDNMFSFILSWTLFYG